MNNPQTDQDLYHDPEALSPTFFSDDYDISQKESHPTLKLFFTKNVQNPLIHFSVLQKSPSSILPPPFEIYAYVRTYVQVKTNFWADIDTTPYPQLNF